MNDMEKDALERRIDELCAEVERLHAEQVHWELGNCPKCPNVADLQEALEQNVKLRVLCRDMYLVVSLLDMDGTRLQAHGKDADWRALNERFNELMGWAE